MRSFRAKPPLTKTKANRGSHLPMRDIPKNTHPIVFLHIPKTAGQSVHNQLAQAVGPANVSPVRVHTQAPSGPAQFPKGYDLYSGHIDWTDLACVPHPRFAFSVLRDPRERIASFYFYLLKEARQLTSLQLELPEHAGKKAILSRSVDSYFFGGDAAWTAFIQDHYDNFYCRYFGSGKIRAGAEFGAMTDRRKLRAALRNLSNLDWVYHVNNLSALADDLNTLFGFNLDFDRHRANLGDRPMNEPRWPRLMDRLEKDTTRTLLEDFVTLDLALMERMEF